MPEFECRVIGLHDKNQWFDLGEHPTKFGAVASMLCQLAGRGGQDISLEEIRCRPSRSVKEAAPEEPEK